jgi:NAD(P)-dependent dehydrogenase (short-subunit alcohol dehydrogenase family)
MQRITRVAAILGAALLMLSPCGAVRAEPTAGKAILVTGASSGIGRKITVRLAAHGYFVYAGARKDADLHALAAIRNVQPIRLDVRRPEEIDNAVALITRANRGLYGLVNNAGVATLASFADLSPEEFDLIMAVNVYGPYRVTKAFLPLIVAERGRIVTIGSIAGVIATRQLAAYAMSKHAMEAFTDSLAEELAPVGVQVSLIEPGSYNSEIARNSLRRQGLDPRAGDRTRFKDPDEVAEAVERALFAAIPKRRYLVVPTQQEAELTIRRQIEKLAQLNEDQPYAYRRDELVRMLDERLQPSISRRSGADETKEK